MTVHWIGFPQSMLTTRLIFDPNLAASIRNCTLTSMAAQPKAFYIVRNNTYICKKTNTIPSGNVTYLLDVPPGNSLPHPISPPLVPLSDISLCVIQLHRVGC